MAETMECFRIPVKRTHPDAILPLYATDGAAGADLFCCERIVIEPGEVCLVRTGLSLEVPEGYEGQIRPRSGMSMRYPIIIANAPGTIDSDYRGEVKIVIRNLSTFLPVEIEKGMRIAQLVLAPVARGIFTDEQGLSITTRGTGGFGHTGER